MFGASAESIPDRLLVQGFFVVVLAFAFAPQSVGQDTILYATDVTGSQIYRVDVTSGAMPTVVTNTLGQPDSLIFAPNGNIIYTLFYTGGLGCYDFESKMNYPIHYCPAKISEGRPNPFKISMIMHGRSENDLN